MAEAEPVVPKSESEAEMPPAEDVAMQPYPSPTVKGQDGGPFYTAGARSEQQHQLDLGDQEADQEQLEQPPTPRQQMRHAISSVEELQLAAQLSQGIAHNMPIMESGEDHALEHVVVPRHDMDQQEQHHDDQLHHEAMHQEPMHHDHMHQDHMSQDEMSQDHISQEHISQEHLSQEEMPQEPLPQDHMPQHLMPQDHMAQDHLAQEHMHQDHLHGDLHQGHMHQQHDQLQQQEHEQMAEHEQDLGHALPQDQQDQQGHPPPQQPEYTHDPQHQVPPPPPPPQFQSGTQPMGQYHPHPMFHMPIADSTPPRKRSKVSRACDECRRKKVKCDAKSETGEHPCSNCRRVNARCLFSRIPQKRGPSKGYIKELADRINSIEGKLASEGNADTLAELLKAARGEPSAINPGDLTDWGAGEEEENGRKRPYSSISGADFDTPPAANSRQPTWSSEPRPQPASTPTDRSRPPYSANDLAPAAEAPDAGPPAFIDNNPDLHLVQGGRSTTETAYNGYLEVCHPCLPLLPDTRVRMQGLLAQCPVPLRDAFVEAFNAAMQSFPSFTGPYANGDLVAASRAMTEWESDRTPRSMVMHTVALQTLILIAIATDNHGPASLSGGPGKASVLGRAIGSAYSLRLHTALAKLDTSKNVVSGTTENLALRCWWVLVVLDRWNAISTASPLMIPNEAVVILPGLAALVGDTAYHLVRLSTVLSGFSLAVLEPPKTMSLSGAPPVLNYFINLSMELFRAPLPEGITPGEYPALHLGYWHCKLLASLLQTTTRPTDVLWVCKESAGLLMDHPLLITPLTHHFFCLTTLVLLELRKVESTRDEASSYLKKLLDCSSAPSSWDATVRDRIAEQTRPSTADGPSTAERPLTGTEGPSTAEGPSTVEGPSTAEGTMEPTASQGTLQHLADIATAAELNAAKAETNGEPVAAQTVDKHGDGIFDAAGVILRGYLNVMAEPRSAR